MQIGVYGRRPNEKHRVLKVVKLIKGGIRMAQGVIVKKSEKVNGIFNQLGDDCSLEDFSKKFKEDYA